MSVAPSMRVSSDLGAACAAPVSYDPSPDAPTVPCSRLVVLDTREARQPVRRELEALFALLAYALACGSIGCFGLWLVLR